MFKVLEIAGSAPAVEIGKGFATHAEAAAAVRRHLKGFKASRLPGTIALFKGTCRSAPIPHRSGPSDRQPAAGTVFGMGGGSPRLRPPRPDRLVQDRKADRSAKALMSQNDKHKKSPCIVSVPFLVAGPGALGRMHVRFRRAGGRPGV
jgi:hypothetical protein